MHCRAIENLRQRFVEDGFEVTLEGKPRGHRPRALTGEDDARLIALVCMDECPKQLVYDVLAEVLRGNGT
jgi:transposase